MIKATTNDGTGIIVFAWLPELKVVDQANKQRTKLAQYQYVIIDELSFSFYIPFDLRKQICPFVSLLGLW
jgi:hypothetical protein